MKIGWIGLGAIGVNMVDRALSRGLNVTAFARGQGVEQAEAKGAFLSYDYRTLANGSDVLVLCLFDDHQVRQVLFDQGSLAAMRPGSTVVIHTTGSPQLAREIARRAPSGVAVVDAAFSGGPEAALAGDLTIMVGGEAQDIEQVRPLLCAYAKQIAHVGPLGGGQTAKLLNNLLFATNLRNAAEILRIGETQGFNTFEFAKLIQCCSGGSSAMRSFCSDSPVDQTLARLRRFLDKDVATVAGDAKNNSINIEYFAETLNYFTKAS